MDISHKASPKEIRDAIKGEDELTVDFLAKALMELCSHVSEVDLKVKHLRAKR